MRAIKEYKNCVGTETLALAGVNLTRLSSRNLTRLSSVVTKHGDDYLVDLLNKVDDINRMLIPCWREQKT